MHVLSTFVQNDKQYLSNNKQQLINRLNIFKMLFHESSVQLICCILSLIRFFMITVDHYWDLFLLIVTHSLFHSCTHLFSVIVFTVSYLLTGCSVPLLTSCYNSCFSMILVSGSFLVM